MTIGVRDASGTARTASQIKVRDASGVSRTVSEIRVRDAAGTSRVAYTVSGGSGAPAISPSDSNTASRTSRGHTTAFSIINAAGATAYVWGTTGAILASGQGTANASFTLYDDGSGSFASIWCDVTISGTTTRLYATMEHYWFGSTGTL